MHSLSQDIGVCWRDGAITWTRRSSAQKVQEILSYLVRESDLLIAIADSELNHHHYRYSTCYLSSDSSEALSGAHYTVIPSDCARG